MLVFFKERLVFLAVPKTGSTAYHTALAKRADLVITNPPELKHAPLFRYDRFVRPMFQKVCGVDLETLAVVREPIRWLGSWYRYRRRPFTIGKPTSTHDISFDEFVSGYIRGTQPDYAQVGSQARFLTPRPGGLPVTHLFRYDQIDRLDAFLSHRLEMQVETRRENESPSLNLELSPETEQRLRQKCADEFALYDSIGR